MESAIEWLNPKGYLHITSRIDVTRRKLEIHQKITNPSYIAQYAFYPLMHTIIKERKLKKIDGSKKRRHVVKPRPIHYATHFDALIFAYYAQILQDKYEQEIKKHTHLNHCVIAYRKIPTGLESANKSTIHFASELFEEIKQRTKITDEVAVLTFDIKSFFSTLNHNLLYKAWTNLLGCDKLPKDHYNVFKAATKFSWVLLDDLRVKRNGGFDEKELARIRKNFGVEAFFESPRAFREKIKSGKLKIYSHKKKSLNSGIPQGLPISAILANLYLLNFDMKVYESVVENIGGYYKRYSDDIAIICPVEKIEQVDSLMNKLVIESSLQLSTEKTEKFIFRKSKFGNKEPRLTCINIHNNSERIGKPLTYLGFEFNGFRTIIKSRNLSKFYRRLIFTVKRKAKRANRISLNNPFQKPVIYRNQLYKLYTNLSFKNCKIRRNWKSLERKENGQYYYKTHKKSKKIKSNYLTYVRRSSEIMKDEIIKHQIRKHKSICNEAIHKHLKFGSVAANLKQPLKRPLNKKLRE